MDLYGVQRLARGAALQDSSVGQTQLDLGRPTPPVSSRSLNESGL